MQNVSTHDRHGGPYFLPFRFTVTYRPGHKNLKADALSRLHQPDPSGDCPEPILSPTVFVCPIEGALDDQFVPPLWTNLLRWEARKGRVLYQLLYASPFWILFIPLRDQVTQVANEPSRFSETDTGGPTCLGMSPATSRVVRSVPLHWHPTIVCQKGKLVPLPHSAPTLVSISELICYRPSSLNGFTTILVVIDRFYKGLKNSSLYGGYPQHWRRAEGSIPTRLSEFWYTWRYSFR